MIPSWCAVKTCRPQRGIGKSAVDHNAHEAGCRQATRQPRFRTLLDGRLRTGPRDRLFTARDDRGSSSADQDATPTAAGQSLDDRGVRTGRPRCNTDDNRIMAERERADMCCVTLERHGVCNSRNKTMIRLLK